MITHALGSIPRALGSRINRRTIRSLFRRHSPGIWYDPQDLTTMYQDAAGTLPVYRPGTGLVDPPVGLMLDKSGGGYHASQSTTTARPTLSGRYNLLTATETLATQSVTTAATTYTLSFSGTGTITLSGTATGVKSAGTHTIACTIGTLTCTVAGVVTRADLRASNDGVGLPPYQRVDSATTYDTAGFPLYLKFDGVDDLLKTANVDLTGTDEVTVGVGLRKITDAVTGAIVCEFSDNTNFNAGSFYLTAPNNPNAGNIANFSRGTAPLSVSHGAINTVSAPATITTLATHDISADRTRATLNGHNETIATGDKGDGNFGNYPLYVGARGGTSLPFKGNIYSLCIIGTLLSTSEQALLERYLNAKTMAY